MRKNTALKKQPIKSFNRSRSYNSRPFWLPAAGFYILAAATVIAFFFFLWWILHEGGEEMPYIPAGIGASIVLGGAVFLREVVLRRARQKFLKTQKMLDHNLKRVGAATKGKYPKQKLSINENAAIIEEIKRKSEAALILEKFSEGHWEVFELCNRYLHRNRSELETVGIGSPRLAALRRGREIVREIHKLHLISWAEIESRDNIKTAKNQIALPEKLEFMQKALGVIDTALEFYPQEKQLLESKDAIIEFNFTTKLSHLIESAEKAAFKGEKKEAVNLYTDALYFLQKEKIQNSDRRLIEQNILAEIEKIKQNLQIEN